MNSAFDRYQPTRYEIVEDIPDHGPPEYTRYAWENARHRAAKAIYEAIAPVRPGVESEHYAIKVIEHEIPGWANTSVAPRPLVAKSIGITWEITAIRYHKYEMMMPAYEDMPWKQLSLSATAELKRRIKNKINKLFRKE